MFYRSIVENVNIGITFIDAEHTIVKTNLAQAQMFGKSVDTFCGKKCFSEYEKRCQVCPHCPGTLRHVDRQAGCKSRPQAFGDDGSRFPVRVKAMPMFGPGKIVTGFIEVVEDITEQKRTEERRRSSRRWWPPRTGPWKTYGGPGSRHPRQVTNSSPT